MNIAELEMLTIIYLYLDNDMIIFKNNNGGRILI